MRGEDVIFLKLRRWVILGDRDLKIITKTMTDASRVILSSGTSIQSAREGAYFKIPRKAKDRRIWTHKEA